MEKDQIFILEDRGVLYINGKDSKEFLQNIITNVKISILSIPDPPKVHRNLTTANTLKSSSASYACAIIQAKEKLALNNVNQN